MATAVQKQQCPACNGRRLVQNGKGQVQTCPLCDGSGSVTPQPIRVPFDYPINFAALVGSSANNTASIQFDRDAPFEWVWAVATETGTFSSRMEDGATGRKFDSDFVNNANRFGTAQLPFPLVEPYIFAPGTTCNFTINETSTNTNTIQIVLKGYKLYPAATS
jgi:hypothetical protein